MTPDQLIQLRIDQESAARDEIDRVYAVKARHRKSNSALLGWALAIALAIGAIASAWVTTGGWHGQG